MCIWGDKKPALVHELEKEEAIEAYKILSGWYGATLRSPFQHSTWTRQPKKAHRLGPKNSGIYCYKTLAAAKRIRRRHEVVVKVLLYGKVYEYSRPQGYRAEKAQIVGIVENQAYQRSYMLNSHIVRLYEKFGRVAAK